MRSRLLRNISANILQQAINQLFGLAIFYMLSNQLSKTTFGEFNWSLAFLFTSFTILSFGLDQLTVKKIAAGQPVAAVLSSHLLHVILSGSIFYILLVICCLLLHQQPIAQLLLLLGAGKLLSFFASPFKQAAAGQEAFSIFAWMSVTSNVIKGIAMLLCVFLHTDTLTLQLLICIFIAGDAAELFISMFLFYKRNNTHTSLYIGKKVYNNLLKESMPQLGVVASSALMARFDWILIGLIATAAQLAEYSFAYKAFEMATFPLLVVAPLLIPRFVKYFRNEQSVTDGMYAIMRVEMFIAAFVILLLNICWTPAIDAITGNQYGGVNSNTIFILSLCTPFLYINNILWTNSFAQGKLRSIFIIIGITCIINIAGDCLLIPFLKNEGAAIAYLISLLIQLILYTKACKEITGSQISFIIAGCPLCAVISLFITRTFASGLLSSLATGISLYILLILLGGLFVKKDIQQSIHLLSPESVSKTNPDRS